MASKLQNKVPNTPKNVIPCIQTTQIHTPHTTSKFVPSFSVPKSPKKKSKTSIQTLKKDRTKPLKNCLREFLDLVTYFKNRNKSTIFDDLKVKPLCNIIESYMSLLCDEINKFHDLIDSITNPEEYRRVSLSTLKQRSYIFAQKLKELHSLLTIIKNDGIKSNVEYISVKFTKIESIITTIALKHKRVCSKTRELERSGGVLLSLLETNRNGICMLLNERELLQREPKMKDTAINDLKQFVHLYNQTSLELFNYSGYMQCELAQFKTNFQLAINDIIDGIRCCFSFDENMDEIMNSFDKFNSTLAEMIADAKLPEITSYEVEKIKVPEPVAKEIEKNVFEELESYVGDYNKNEEDIVFSSKLEYFIDKISSELNVTIEPNDNVWFRMEDLIGEFTKRIDSVKSLESEIDGLHKKLKDQKKTLQEIIEQKNTEIMKRGIEMDKLEQDKDSIIAENNELKNKIQKDLAQITHQRQIIYDLRNKLDKKYQNDFVDDIGQKMGTMMTQLDYNTMIPDDDELQSKKRLDVVVLEKRCSKCALYEKLAFETRAKVKELIDLPKNATLPRVVEALIDEYKNVHSNYIAACEENSHLKEEIFVLKDANQKVLDQIAQILNEEGVVKVKEGTAIEIAKALKKSFDKLREHFMKQIKDIKEKVIASQNEKLLELLQLFRGIIPDSEGDEKLDYIDLITKKFKILDEKYRVLQITNYNNVSVLKVVEKWMNEKTGFITDGLPYEHSIPMMIKAIDEAPNPLQCIVDEMKAEKKLARSELEACYKRLTEEKKPDEDIDEKECEIVVLISTIHMLIEEVCDEQHAREFIIQQQKQEINNFSEILKSKIKLLASLLNYDEINTDNMELAALIQQFELIIEDLYSDDGNSHFIAIKTINDLTKEGRVFVDQQHTNRPTQYLPIIMENFVKQCKTLIAINNIKKYLDHIFKRFDFNYDSFDPHNASFSDIRNEIFNLHQIVADSFCTDGIIASVNVVVRRVLALASIFLSAVVSIKIGSDEEYRESLNNIRNQLLV